jgi:alanine dehydrogenase
VLHYGVTNMPSQTARTSTLALTAATLPYIVQLADKGINKCLKKNKQIRNAVNCYAGHLCNEAVAESLGQSYSKIEDLL